MQTVNVSWALPTTRESGRPLDPAAIAFVRLEISADGGANYGKFGDFTPDVLATDVPDLEPGAWFFRGTVTDKAGKTSKPLVGSITLADTSPPGALLALVLNAL
jgi:hypothetical protein